MILYLDTSALVKLYVEESGSREVQGLLEQAGRAGTSRISYVEARAAFARRQREGALSKAHYQEVVKSLERDWETFLLLDLTQPILRSADDLTERHALRAYDAIHLATALSVRPALAMEFVAADERLLAAAAKEGLVIRRA